MKKYYRKISSIFLATMLSISCTFPVFAHEISVNDMHFCVKESEKNNLITQLMLERSKLEVEYSKNRSKIAEIDSQLNSLGVTEVSTFELENRMGIDVSPYYIVNPTSTTRWTSRRVVTTYRGKQYELQIIEGVPTSADSPLRYDSSRVYYEARGVKAGIAKVLQVLSVSALGAIPEIGSELAAGVTVYDAIKGMVSNLTTSTLIDKITGTGVVSLTTHMKFVYVKEYGQPDTGNQVLCYQGNSVTYLLSTISVVDTFENGNLKTLHDVSVSRDSSTVSERYNDYSVPVENFYSYKYNGNSNFTYDYTVKSIKIKMLNRTENYKVPSEFANIS